MGGVTPPLSCWSEQTEFELTEGTTWLSTDKWLQILIATFITGISMGVMAAYLAEIINKTKLWIMKKATELREITAPEIVGDKICKQMAAECGLAAEKGRLSHEFLCDKQYVTAAVDFAISELVALGFKIDKVDHESTIYDHYKISW